MNTISLKPEERAKVRSKTFHGIAEAIEAKEKERENIFTELEKIENMINKLKSQKYILLDQDTDLYYEIEELKEQLNNEL